MKSVPRHSYTMGARAEAVAETRDRIARAMLKLALAQPFEDITLVAIAHAAGVSHQTVLNHFESKEGVAVAAAQILARDTSAARAKAKPVDLAGAIAVLVGEYERIGDANVRWAMSSERLGSLAALLDEARVGHQAWLMRMFGEMLPRTGPAQRRAILALHAATDVYTWKLLRRDLRLTRQETEAVITELVKGIVTPRVVRGRRHPSGQRHGGLR